VTVSSPRAYARDRLAGAEEAVDARRGVEGLDPEIDADRVAEARLEQFDRRIADERHVRSMPFSRFQATMARST